MTLAERVEQCFETSDKVVAYVADNMAVTDHAQQVSVDLAAFIGAVRKALVEIASEIDKLTAAQRNQ